MLMFTILRYFVFKFDFKIMQKKHSSVVIWKIINFIYLFAIFHNIGVKRFEAQK